ncbi:MAG: hypothetical protein ABR506_13425, partial [Candidatus Krumholzibacteriia bacterium]
LRLGKASMVSVGLRDNSQRYNLTGDPATKLPHPDDSLAFAAASLDTLRTGQLHRAVVAAAGVAGVAYDPDSYTSGRLAFGLPSDLAPGRHTAALYAADALGNVGSDTLSFDLGAAGAADLGPISVFPNPTAGPCRLVFELSDPMEVRWDIYTVAGRRIRSVHERLAGAGPGILAWDGRDAEGDEIANGTYLYVLRGLGAGGDGRDITRTGKLVIMR